MSATELMEEGIRAYTQGDLGEAERCWREVLTVDPGSTRARSYLALLASRVGMPPPLGAAAGRAQAAQAPAPASPAAPPPPHPAAAARAAPPPAFPEWMAPPVTVPPVAPAPAPALVEPPLIPAAAMPLAAATPAPRPAPVAPPDYAPSPWDQGPALAPAVVLGEGDGLDLASVEEKSELRPLVPEPGSGPAPGARPRSDVELWMDGARELFALGDFSGSLEMIEQILKVDPSHREARAYLEQNEATLIAMYESKLGSLEAVPRLAIQPEEVMWLNLDHRAGFLLAQIDGFVSYEDLFALSGVPRLDTARILASLLQEGVIHSG